MEATMTGAVEARGPAHERKIDVAGFGRAIDALRKEVEGKVGSEDVAYIKRVKKLSNRAELLGRSLIHVSLEPLGFGLGVAALTFHKLLETIEIGHTSLHGTYDRLAGCEEFNSKTFHWKVPIDEASWKHAHNVQHHQYTNVNGRDPDMNFAVLRLSPEVPYRPMHRLQPVSNALSFLGFTATINTHVTGLVDVYAAYPRQAETLRDHSAQSKWDAHKIAFRKFARYYAREYGFFPLLAGPFFWKVILGNWLSEIGRDVYAGATIYCGHVGATDYPQGAHASGRAEWYVMQVEASRDFEVSAPFDLMCGGLERQIEHHLFPRLPPNRLREIAPRVRAICEQYGVRYRTDSWPGTLRDVFGTLGKLAKRSASDRLAPKKAVAA
jgi:fatty acid desaturase